MSNKKNFCIITTQRSGSSWLRQLLNSHPQIKTFRGEPFVLRKPEKVPFFEENGIFIPYCHYVQNNSVSRPGVMFNYLDILKTYQSQSYDAIGFKVMYNQILANPEFLFKIILDRYRIIHLVRNNYLDIVISGTVAKEKGIFHVKESNSGINSITLDTKSLISKLDYVDRRIKLSKTLLNLIPLSVLEVTYESLANDRDRTLKYIADFLQVDSSKSIVYESKLKKANPGSYEDKIVNYDEVVKTLENSKYSKFLVN